MLEFNDGAGDGTDRLLRGIINCVKILTRDGDYAHHSNNSDILCLLHFYLDSRNSVSCDFCPLKIWQLRAVTSIFGFSNDLMYFNVSLYIKYSDSNGGSLQLRHSLHMYFYTATLIHIAFCQKFECGTQIQVQNTNTNNVIDVN